MHYNRIEEITKPGKSAKFSLQNICILRIIAKIAEIVSLSILKDIIVFEK
jgi:hypothetical protein